MPRTLPELLGVPGSKCFCLGFLASKLLNYAIVHLWRYAIFHEMASAVPIALGTHRLDRPHDFVLLISGQLR